MILQTSLIQGLETQSAAGQVNSLQDFPEDVVMQLITKQIYEPQQRGSKENARVKAS